MVYDRAGSAPNNTLMQLTIEDELHLLLQSVHRSGEATEYRLDVGALLHGDDLWRGEVRVYRSMLHPHTHPELIFLVHPHQEGLVGVVEDTSAGWPVSVKVASLKKSIAFPIYNLI